MEKLMVYGPTMRLATGDLTIELASVDKESMAAFAAGMAHASVTRYLSRSAAPTIEDEYEWRDKVRADPTRINWGVFDVTNDNRLPIGDTALMRIERTHVHRATSGSVIFRKDYWRKGIASAIHMARTWYAFQHLGLHCIDSAVIQGNHGSRRALEKSGYRVTHVKRNEQYIDGSLRHLDHLEVLNPLPAFWGQWWHGDEPDAEAITTRAITEEVMAWAEKHVELL